MRKDLESMLRIVIKYVCTKCGKEFWTADGDRAIRCPYCSEPIKEIK